MATYSCHRLIMGEWKLTSSAVSLQIFEQKKSHICLLSSPPRFIRLSSKSLNLICRWGDMNDNFLKCILKNLLLGNHKGDEAKIWHTCLGN